MHCYVVIEAFLIVDYAISVFISASLKIWTWLQVGHTHNMGVVAPRAPLLKFLEITTDYQLTTTLLIVIFRHSFIPCRHTFFIFKATFFAQGVLILDIKLASFVKWVQFYGGQP